MCGGGGGGSQHLPQQHIHNDITACTRCITILISTTVNSITASIEMTSRGNKTFRVRCTSTGGRVLNMSVTGPDFNSDLSNIQAVGTLKKMGNDIYTATTGSITGGSERQLYYCTASNGVSTLMGCVGLKGGFVPSVVLLIDVSK